MIETRLDGDGRPYYFDSQTGASVWDLGEWGIESRVDHAGEPYYYQTHSGAQAWSLVDLSAEEMSDGGYDNSAPSVYGNGDDGIQEVQDTSGR